MSAMPGRSTLMTSAPSQASSWVQVGPDWTCVKSRMRTPVRALPARPRALLDGRASWPLPFAFLAATALDLSFTTFLDAALALPLPFDFLRVAIDVFLLNSLSWNRLFLLLKLALRIEVADAAALAAGGRIDHRVDQGRLPAIH